MSSVGTIHHYSHLSSCFPCCLSLSSHGSLKLDGQSHVFAEHCQHDQDDDGHLDNDDDGHNGQDDDGDDKITLSQIQGPPPQAFKDNLYHSS